MTRQQRWSLLAIPFLLYAAGWVALRVGATETVKACETSQGSARAAPDRPGLFGYYVVSRRCVWAFFGAAENEKPLIVLATLGLLTIAIGQVVLFQRQLSMMRSTLDDTRRQFNAEYRPWLAVTMSLGSGVMYSPDIGYYIVLNCTLFNTGRAPALRVRPHGRLFFYPNAGSDPATEQRRLSDQVRQQRANASVPGSAIFPNTPGEAVLTITMTAADRRAWEGWHARLPDSAHPEAKLMLVGCVAYSSAVDDREHQTGFIFELHAGRHAGDQGRYPITPEGVDVQSDRLHRDPSRFGSGVTD
jgi:hypothetical protein